MKLKSILILSVLILLVFNMNIYASPLEERLNLVIDIGSYIELIILNDINIILERPWEGGEIKEAKSGLFLQTNTNVELSWECTGLKDEKTGRVLPLGISEKRLKAANSPENREVIVDQPFGLTASLLNKGEERTKKPNCQYISYIDEEKILRSKDIYNFGPGTHEFDIILQYYWSADSRWSEIRAGEYKGQIVFTVSALEDSSD